MVRTSSTTVYRLAEVVGCPGASTTVYRLAEVVGCPGASTTVYRLAEVVGCPGVGSPGEWLPPSASRGWVFHSLPCLVPCRLRSSPHRSWSLFSCLYSRASVNGSAIPDKPPNLTTGLRVIHSIQQIQRNIYIFSTQMAYSTYRFCLCSGAHSNTQCMLLYRVYIHKLTR